MTEIYLIFSPREKSISPKRNSHFEVEENYVKISEFIKSSLQCKPQRAQERRNVKCAVALKEGRRTLNSTREAAASGIDMLFANLSSSNKNTPSLYMVIHSLSQMCYMGWSRCPTTAHTSTRFPFFNF